MKNITLKDVAQRCKVSKATVSRVMSGSDKISERTKKKVLSAVNELGYIPNANAQSLVNKKTQSIGLLIPASKNYDFIFENQFYIECLTYLSLFAEEKGYYLLTMVSSNDNELELLKNTVGTNKVDGIILLSSKKSDENIKYLHNIQKPFVVIGNVDEYFKQIVYHVDNNNEQISYNITKEFLNAGIDKILFITGSKNLHVSIDRQKGFEKAYKDLKRKFDYSYIKHGIFSEFEGLQIVKEFDKEIQAILTTDDVFAIGAKKFLSNKPIVGFNNSKLSEILNINTVDIKTNKLCQKAIDILVDLLDEKMPDKKEYIIKAKFIERN
ncbi:MAG: LacI family DNA-binding transcriptional regulator [Tissierellia bacterium]|nr:LacI family DNA-binding transcriptional regulator [Tissierellia bacterium]